ncbi:glutathione S-transferase 4-like [Oryza glaberrima]|uniref:Uncharacterized protein n=1 Tax=Oryza glaberrima TaxID=4538 RepID=I1QEX4_ORYGL|nr:glutathione S-transferase 4-like [Oryza glaberrima]
MGVRVTGPAGSPLVAAVLASLEEAAAGGGYELVGMAAARERSTRPHLARNPFGKIAAFAEDGELALVDAVGGHVDGSRSHARVTS